MQLTGEIADGWIPIFFSPEHVGESRELLEEGAARAGRDLERLLRHRPVGERLHRRRHRPRPRLGAPPARALRGRDGLAREELLQRARAPLRVRGRGADGAGPLPGRQEGRGRRGAARGADRHRGHRGPARQGARPARGLPRRGRGHAHRLDRSRPTPSGASRWSATSRRCSERSARAAPAPAPGRVRGSGARLPGDRPGARAGGPRPRRLARDLGALARARGARGDALRARARVPPARGGQARRSGSTRPRCAPASPPAS